MRALLLQPGCKPQPVTLYGQPNAAIGGQLGCRYWEAVKVSRPPVDLFLAVDENGKDDPMHVRNEPATQLAGWHLRPGDYIAGSALVLGMDRGGVRGLTDDEVIRVGARLVKDETRSIRSIPTSKELNHGA